MATAAKEKDPTPKRAEVTLPDAVDLNVGYGSGKFVFKFKMLTIEEEREWTNADAAKLDEKHDPVKDYERMREKLARVSLAPIMGRTEDNELVPIVDGATAGDSIREFFKDYGAAKERLLVQTYVEYRNAMVPTKSFL